MKIIGTNLSKLNEVVLVFERNGFDPETGAEPDNIVFTLRPVAEFQPFMDLVAEPKPPIKILKGGTKEEDISNPEYQQAMAAYSTKQMNYILIHSMLATEGLEFEKVVLTDPETWGLIVEELQAFLYDQEIFKLYEAATQVNSVTDDSLEQARKRFLALRRQNQ